MTWRTNPALFSALRHLSDDGLEQQVLDRLSFMRFLGLSMGDDVPDSKTMEANISKDDSSPSPPAAPRSSTARARDAGGFMP